MTERPLRELVADLDRTENDLTLYAREPWTADSPAVAAREDSPEAGDARAAGLSYLLEVDLAAEVIETWRAWRGGAAPTSAEACAAVIHYATYDAYQPVEHPRP